MFLRRSTRHKDGKPPTYYALVASARTEAGPRQPVGDHLGELNHEEQRRWQRPGVISNRQGESQQLRLFPDSDPVPVPDDPEVGRVRRGSVGWTNARRFGDVGLGLGLWKLLGLDEIADRHGPQAKQTVRPADLVAREGLTRLGGPGSEFALAEHGSVSPGLEDRLGGPDSAVTKERLYRTRDRLLAAQESIEQDRKRAIRRRQRRGLARGLRRLERLISTGRLKNRDKLLERGGRLPGRSPKTRPFVTITVSKAQRAELSWSWPGANFKAALAREGASLLRSHPAGWSAPGLWETSLQLRWESTRSGFSRASCCCVRCGTTPADGPGPR